MAITSSKTPMTDDNYQLWQAAVAKALGGRSEQVLTSKTLDALLRGPLLTLADNPQNSGIAGQFPFTRGVSSQREQSLPWGICCEVFVSDDEQANRLVLQELSGGASAIQLQFKNSNCDLKTVLRGVDLNIATVNLQPGLQSAEYAREFVNFLAQENTDLAKVSGNLGLSPIGFAVANDSICDLAKWAIDNATGIRSLSICSNLVHEAGGSEALELAWLAAETAHNMRTLLQAGIKPDDAAGQMQAIISMDADLHLGIAKLRAARRVWAETVTAFGVSEQAAGLQIHARSSLRMFSRYDPWVNILRTSTAALAAVIGGAQEVLVTPFTYRLGAADEMARRLARNTQIVLMEECAAGRVVDPAGGSYAHEQMSEQLALKAWEYFQTIEAQGGLVAAIDNGWLGKTVAQMRDTRQQLIRKRKISIIGVNQYANLHEESPNTSDCRPPVTPDNRAGLDQFYDAEEFEQLRDQAKSLSGKVFIASLGTLKQSALRVGFVKNLLAAGGIETTKAKHWQNQTEMLADFDVAVTPIVVVCGSDAQYGTEMVQLAEQFKAKCAKQVWIAGGSEVPEGFDGRMAIGDDVIAILQVVLSSLGSSQ